MAQMTTQNTRLFSGEDLAYQRDEFWDGALKNARKKGGPKERCLLINKQEDWVNHLRRAGESTKKKQYTKGTKNNLKSARFTQNQVAAGISSIITEPNVEWYKLKRSQYVLEKTFHGLCTSC